MLHQSFYSTNAICPFKLGFAVAASDVYAVDGYVPAGHEPFRKQVSGGNHFDGLAGPRPV